ncbi:hypothetical protein NQ534_06700 [Marvinbryantia formatexigens DSM 14469]|nr:hypothetical protein [Marvinbryantia formatexigens]UWO26149.1 hypothetical protein NQ534_06700 [Marvinbryantia formatexigens DSM 14469]SDF92581.1 hypothetical protein SAMN05660368_01603 [Marvinbryantia formatexigens]
MRHIMDPQNKLNLLYSALDRKPFRETAVIYFIKNGTGQEGQGSIQEAIQLEEQFTAADTASVQIPPKIILAGMNAAENTDNSLMFAHTHPPSELYPEECRVYTEAGFSEQDLHFNNLINELLRKKRMISKPVYLIYI